jgi:trehalose 6-phosphate synthase
MPDETYDVAIVGAGSAGTTLAEQLRIHAPDLRVALFDRRIELADPPRVIHTDIVDIEAGRANLTLVTNSEQNYFARKVVLATGQFPPGDPSTKDRAFHRSERYLSVPLQPDFFEQIRTEDEILILGSGKVTLALLSDFKTKRIGNNIQIVSKTGLFPQPQEQGHGTKLDFPALPQRLRSLVNTILERARAAGAQGIGWYPIIETLQPNLPFIWSSLTLPDRKRFVRYIRPYWELAFAPVPRDLLDLAGTMLERGQVVVYGGRIQEIVESENGFDVSFFERTSRRTEQLHPAWIINCTHSECTYRKLDAPLLVNLLARGLIHPDPLFLGLNTAANGAVLNYLGQPSTSMFTFGGATESVITVQPAELQTMGAGLAQELATSQEQGQAPAAVENVVIISNRGPNDFVWKDDQWVPKTSTGGLVSMIEPLARRSDVTWFCCVSEPPPAAESRGALFTTVADQTDPDYNLIAVPLPSNVYRAYYGTISNEVLWMLQHHLIGEIGYSSINEARQRAWDEGYLEANRRLVKAVRASGIQPRAFLVQDYHLYPLPALLREAFPNTPSLHFTHIPFPDPATLKLIPKSWRNAILSGLLGADLVGMQTEWDTRPFLMCCEELLGTEVDYARGKVRAPDGRQVRVRAFPASTDPEALNQTMGSPAVEAARSRLAPDLAGLSIIRVDRLDPSKNQLIGFEAFGRLLETRPDLRGRVRFLAFLVPSRTDLSVYRDYRDAVYATIERVNNRFAGEFQPIKVFYTNDREQALAAMEQCDVLFVNSREDGMNLVVKEFAIVSKRPGVAIISETAGVASETSESALLISPLDIEGTAQAMAQALEMPKPERAARLDMLRKGVKAWTAKDWLEAQLKELGITDRPLMDRPI